jgi:hypothetical protein
VPVTDAVVGVDTHRDTHEVEIALPTGTPIARRQISNDSAGFTELVAWIIDHAPGPRWVVSIEGTRGTSIEPCATGAFYGRRVTRPSDPPARFGLVGIRCHGGMAGKPPRPHEWHRHEGGDHAPSPS